MIKKFLKLFIYLIPGILYCSIDLADTGGGSEVGNGIITGSIYNINGTPASNARVSLRRKDFLKDTSEAYFIKEYIDSADTFTDNKGTFWFDSVDTGKYCIEVAIEDSLAVLLECELTKQDSNLIIPNDTLAPMGKIIGNVSLYGGPKAKRFIQVYGLDRVVETDTSGNFTIDVPEGEFTLRVVIGMSEYKEVDIPNIITDSAPISVMLLAENPISDSYICDTLIIRALLDSNGLSTISVNSVISGMNNGRVSDLEIRESLFSTIPSVIGGLHTVESLEMEKTLVSSLPSRFGELINIIELELDSNQLTTLPLEITNITQLVLLDLSYNRLRNLLPAVKDWANRFDPDWADTQDTTEVIK